MTMKRRVIYMSDEEWEALHEQARSEKATISALIRSRITTETTRLAALGTGDDVRPRRTFTPVPKPSKR